MKLVASVFLLFIYLNANGQVGPPRNWVDSKIKYTDSKGNSVMMTNSLPKGGTVLSHFQAIDKWVTINGCNPTPTVTDLPDISNDGTTIKQRVSGKQV